MDADHRAVAEGLRERAERMLAAVRGAYGPAPEREPLPYSRGHDPDTYPDAVDEQVERLGGIGGALVRDDDGRVLVVDVNYTERDWQSPGGAVEPGDSLPTTARKEVREVTGVEVELTGLLYTRAVHYEYDAGVAVLPMAVFTARKTGGALRVPDRTIPDGRDEIADVRWFRPADLPPSTLDYEWIRARCEGRSRPE